MKIYSVQNLRYVLAMVIVVYHILMFPAIMITEAEILKYAVDIFFVISGFVITLSLYKSTNNFLRKRIKTVYPKYYFYLTVIIVIKLIGVALGYVDQVANLLISYTLLPVMNDSGYLIRPELVVGWTLMYEMTFYLLISLIILFTKNKERIINITIGILVICAMITLLTDFSTAIPYLNLLVDNDLLILNFLMGMIIAKVYHQQSFKVNQFTALMLIGSGIIILIGLDNFLFTARGLISFIPSTLILIGVIKYPCKNENRAQKRGNYSYEIYLMHTLIVSSICIFVFEVLKLEITSWGLLVLITIIYATIMLCLKLSDYFQLKKHQLLSN